MRFDCLCYDFSSEFSADAFHELWIFFLFVSEGGRVDIDSLLFGVVKDFCLAHSCHEFFALFLQALLDGLSSSFPASNENDGIEGLAFREGGEVDFFLLLLGRHLLQLYL